MTNPSNIRKELRYRYALTAWIAIKEIMWNILSIIAVLGTILIFIVPLIGYIASN